MLSYFEIAEPIRLLKIPRSLSEYALLTIIKIIIDVNYVPLKLKIISINYYFTMYNNFLHYSISIFQGSNSYLVFHQCLMPSCSSQVQSNRQRYKVREQKNSLLKILLM